MAKSTQVILGMFKEDFEVNNCLEWSQYIQGQTTQPCLKNEKFLIKKGTTFQSKRNDIAFDPAPSDDSYVNIPYQNGDFSVPLSKVLILEFKYVTKDELMNFKNNFDTTNNKNTQSQNKIISFLESHPKLIMIIFIGIGVYIGYKKFIK
jgi:hypothetical protein